MKTIKLESDSSPVLTVHIKWLLRLYVTMQTPVSIMAQSDLNNICEEEMKGIYQVELINLLRNPQLAPDHRILPISQLVSKLPKPLRNVIEDLSCRDRVLVGIELVNKS